MSFMVLARESYNRQQLQSPFVCRAYDMASENKYRWWTSWERKVKLGM